MSGATSDTRNPSLNKKDKILDFTELMFQGG